MNVLVVLDEHCAVVLVADAAFAWPGLVTMIELVFAAVDHLDAIAVVESVLFEDLVLMEL